MDEPLIIFIVAAFDETVRWQRSLQVCPSASLGFPPEFSAGHMVAQGGDLRWDARDGVRQSE
jgi:hypothetical protein